ncbi:MAG: AsmA family protein [Pseudomonadota bacterium]
MARIIKWALGIAAALILLVVAAVTVAVLVFDPEDYREDIELALTEATGRQVTVGGELTMNLFPWLSIRTGDIEVAAAPAFGPEPMLRIDAVSAGVRLPPLLTGRVEIGTVAIDGFTLNMAVRGDGMTSWQDLLERSTSAEAADTNALPQQEAPELTVAAVEITNAAVTYSDGMSGAEYVIDGFNLSLQDFSPDTATPVDAQFEFRAAPDDIAGALRLTAVLEPGGLETPAVRNLNVSGQINAPFLAGETALSLRTARFVMDSPNNSLAIDEGRLALGPVAGTFSLSGSGPEAPLALTGQVALETFSPREAAALFDVALESADPAVFESLAFSAGLELSYEAAALTGIDARLDDTVLAGDVAYDMVGRPWIRFQLAGGEINLDDYLPPAEDAADAEDAGDAVVATALPVDMIRGLTAQGGLKFERLTLGDLPFESLELGLDIGGDQARLYPLSATVLDGKYRGDVRIDARQATPVLALDERIENLNLGTLARLLYERDNVEGTLAGRFSLTGRGETLADVRETLQGNVELALTDAALTGTDIWYDIRSARARFKGETVPPRPEPARTEISSLQATATVRDGVARNDDLFAEIPFLQLTGAGTVNLADATIDYGLRARVLERPEFLAGATAEELDEYTEAVIPLKLTGDMTAPTIRPDIEGMARDAAKQKIEEEKDRLRRRLLDRLRGDDEDEEPSLEDALKDIFD